MQTVEEFTRGAEHVEDRAHLAGRLDRGDRLRIKWGVDPTAPDLHLGHTVPMRALRRWQDAGHLPVIVIGDWTARIGDPTGRSETRPLLSAETVEANAQTYLDQLFLILARERTEVRRQSEWFAAMGLAEILRLTASRTVQQLLQRADFAERQGAGHAIGVHELLYVLLQGYDSVAVDADVEIGGTDQLFNLLAARDVQRFFGRASAQDVVTFPLLEGLDGARKMSKSYGNHIGITEPPAQQYGKAMSLPDELIVRYLTLVGDLDPAEVERLRGALDTDQLNPRDAKAELARSVVRQFHGEAAAAAAAEEFARVFGAGGIPEKLARLAVHPGPQSSLELVEAALRASGDTTTSRAQMRRLLEQGGVALLGHDGGRQLLSLDSQVTPHPGDVLRVGRRTFVELAAVGAEPLGSEQPGS